MSIRRKLLLTSLACVIPLIVAGIVAYGIARRAVDTEVRRSLAAIAGVEAARVDDLLARTGQQLESLSRSGGLGEAMAAYVAAPSEDLRQVLYRSLRAERERNHELMAVALYAVDGRLVADSSPDGRPTQPVDPALLVRAIHEPQVGRAFRAVTNDARYQQAVPVTDAAVNVVGVLVSESSLQPVIELLARSHQVGRTADLHLVQATNDGRAQYITPPAFAPELQFTRRFSLDERRWLAVQALDGSGEVVASRSDYRNVKVVAGLQRVTTAGWGLVVNLDRDEAFRGVGQMQRALVGAFVATVSAAGLVSILLARSINRRLARVTAAATAISEGDFRRRVGDPSRDELGRLAAAFDRMTARLVDDITQREQAEALLAHQARHDALTGLPNRVRAMERLVVALRHVQPGRSHLAVLFCDLDQFKAVNDGLGHSAGDDLLRQVAERLRRGLRPDDTLARFGGDEFVVICPNLTSAAAADGVAARLREALASPVTVAGKPTIVTMSVGSATTDDPLATPESLIRDADTAMYRAKELGRDRHVALNPEIRANATRGLSVLTDLRRAIDERALSLDYQPLVDLVGGQTIAVEALVRWPHPDRGLLLPAEFLELADRHGLAPALDRWVLASSCRQLGQWRADYGLDDLAMWVNLFATTLADPTLIDVVAITLNATGVPADRVCLEVTEGAFVGDSDAAADQVAALRDLGVRVAVDDFGSGYSSFDRLRRLSFDVLKMDQGLVRDLERDPGARSIAASVARLSADLGMMLVAEGVEHPGQRDALVSLGVQAAQGYLFSPPCSPDDVLVHLLPKFDTVAG